MANPLEHDMSLAKTFESDLRGQSIEKERAGEQLTGPIREAEHLDRAARWSTSGEWPVLTS